MAETEVIEAVDVLPDRVLNPPKANMTKGQRRDEVAHHNIARIEDELFTKSYQVVSDVLDFRDVDLDNPGATMDAWIAEGMDPVEAKKRLRLAESGWNKAGEMPGGVKLAQDTLVGIMKARSNQPAQHIHLSATFIEMPPRQTYEELVEETE